jgi:hypothetical protein
LKEEYGLELIRQDRKVWDIQAEALAPVQSSKAVNRCFGKQTIQRSMSQP